jgi:formylglycine-generating enzyme required for sulfatase activity
VASITIDIPTQILATGEAVQAVATPRDASGRPLTGAALTWSSDVSAVAQVDADGLITGGALGAAHISARSGSVEATVEVSVTTSIPAGELVLIQAGEFEMGDHTGNGDENELPVHAVAITQSFYLQRTEVTQAQWRAVMGSNPSAWPTCGDACPVDGVSWHDVQEFLAILNASDPGARYRLPTEAEWEYAARAGTTGDYGGSGALGAMGWIFDNSGQRPHPVAGKQANAWGLYDMHGNVWEWVEDWYDGGYYAASPAADPPGPASGSYGVVRGGAWSSEPFSARSARRSFPERALRSNTTGFRVARTP